jgi:hypothetical protein
MTVRCQLNLRNKFCRLLLAALALEAACWCAATATAAAPAKKEKGFVALTGADAREHWSGYGLDKAKDTWPPNWEFADGALHCKGGGADLKSRRQYGDFDLRFEWRVSPGANSGVMYRVSQEKDPAYHTGPEYQVVDNARHPDGKHPETSAAAVYALYAPSKDATKPAGEWNKARIVISKNNVEHYLNGTKVAEYNLGSDDWNKRVAASKFAAWKNFGTNPRGHVVLQDHGDEVWYRNVRIKNLDDEPKSK